MKPFLALIALSLLAPAALAQTTKPSEVIVHEWGTFTNFAGSDGVYLDFRPLVDSDLPDFVFDRSMQMRLARSTPFAKLEVITRTRMETPITYFYTAKPTEVSVRVDLLKGLLTDFYPPVQKMGPEFNKDEKYNPAGASFLDWGKLILMPQAMISADVLHLPKIKGESHYAAARETDSAVITYYDTRVGFSTREKFLFYRGIGSFQVPVTLAGKFSTGSSATLQFASGIPEALHGAILVDISDGKVRFSVHHDLKDMAMAIPQTEGTVDQLADAMVQLLIGEGLYEKEARAMVKTWRTSWFGEEGTRLLYLVPQRLTDELLPLQVSPKPQQTVRVMVGRLEMLTPERESRLNQLLRQMGAESPAMREAAFKEVKQLGRFAEPSLQRLLNSSPEPEVRARAEKLLAGLRAGK